MRIPIFELNAFTDSPFSGNPAAVCPLERWLDDRTLQSIAAQNNLAETAFFVRRGAGGDRPPAYDLRWFAPACEVDLCGHATLAAAWVLFHRGGRTGDQVEFHSKSGPLTVRRDGERLELDFPARPGVPCEPPPGLLEGLGALPRETLKQRDYMAVFERAGEVRALAPRMDAIAGLDALGVIATAPGRDTDYVMRFFVPRAGIPEDPATGSVHCMLVPYWAARLGRSRLTARQLSARGGEFVCEHRGARVGIAGHVVPYLEGSIEVRTQATRAARSTVPPDPPGPAAP
jgi:predicted PhzF superfamily epimerase YddE/YHI9